MHEEKSLLSSGWEMVAHNKRYIVWFFLLNLALAWLGVGAFRGQVENTLNHSLQADRLLHGFDVGVLGEMFSQPAFGPARPASMSALSFAFVFLIATVLFLPGVFQGYASNYRLPREDFFRACGRNLWRFIRLMIVAGIVMSIIAGILFALNGAVVKKAQESTYELLGFETRIAGVCLIFLVMTTMRIWFDLSEVDIVLSDQPAVRKSIAASFRHTFQSLARLLGSYVVAAIVAAIILCVGLLAWIKFVPPASVVGAFLFGQITLLLLLIPRFWQRGVAVSYWHQRMMIPVVAVEPIEMQPVPIAVVSDGAPAIPNPPLETPAE